MNEDAVLTSIIEKLKQFGGNKTLLLVSLLNQYNFFKNENKEEKATKVYEEVYLLQCLIAEDVLQSNGFFYDDSGEYPIWKRNLIY